MTDMPYETRFSAALRNIRTERGYTQEQLALYSGLQPSAISHFETGRRRPSMGNLVQLADALGCTLDRLVGR